MTVLASAAAAGLVRTFIKSRLHNWDCTHISDDAQLIATEMVANAVAATPGEEIRFRLSRDTGGVLLAVWDSSAQPPALTPITELTLDTLDTSEEHWDDNGGRGLPIIAALAADCGHQPDPSGGKWVWARIRP
jgi:anti-sigma regulatory factor (Ser/Thr protein kinase)